MIKQLKSDDKDANGMTIIDAHKRMGPCYDFGIPAMAAIAVCDSGTQFTCLVVQKYKYCLLYWYKSTNTDAAGGAAQAACRPLPSVL